MNELIQFNWRAFDVAMTMKVVVGMIVMLVLVEATGEPWPATALAALMAWLAGTPGPLAERIGRMVAFAIGSVAVTIVVGQLALELWSSTAFIAIIGFAGTVGLLLGQGGFMVGLGVITWAIYSPFLVADQGVSNIVLAVLLGTGIVVILNIIGELIGPKGNQVSVADSSGPQTSESIAGPEPSYIIAYAITVAVVVAMTTYFGMTQLTTDPTMMVAGAYYIIGFNVRQTWVAGISRALGLVLGILIGMTIARFLGDGLILQIIMMLTCGLSFGAMGVHPGGWIFFFMIFSAIGYAALDPETLELTLNERLYAEFFGIALAMVAIAFLQWQQNWHKR